ncbi:hypothetical protein SKAU_G00279080 [Synaphobranchus kaupii]|uniref:Uncharacterized protein n=1 Tax=Synaphobranchus kaupii TaxID=118154 RepID=A0A9Q1ILN6_SYNKA|nr:hypothetical protein SKAU_G00279080 [Synaphobranchus kaupii]
MGLPLTPGLTFEPGVDTILQQTAKLHKARETLQQFMATSRPRPAPKQTWQPSTTSSAASGAVAPLPDADVLQLRRVAPSSLPDRLATGLGRFSQAQRANWEERVESPWVLDTVLRGYKLQFRCRPPPYWGIRVTTVSDHSKKEALRLEITSLLSKGAVRRLEPSEQLSGFYSTYFIVLKKDGGYRPILDLRNVNHCLKELDHGSPHLT